MSKPKSSFSRKASGTKSNKLRILIVCEDEKLSVKYFQDLCKALNINSLVKVTGDSGSAPQSVVDYAISFVKELSKDPDYSCDSVYCVIDKDTHAKYNEVVRGFDKTVSKSLKATKFKQPEFKLITRDPCTTSR